MTLPDILQNASACETITRALATDIGSGDVTTLALVPEAAETQAVLVARGDYVVSGTNVARFCFEQVDASLKCTVLLPDGTEVSAGETILEVAGKARGILTAERTALNFMQRMTGIATRTRRFARKVESHNVTILDTRKTTPGLRIFEKYAVLCGNGTNHRMGLYDRFLIKDNHRRLWAEHKQRSLQEAIEASRAAFPGIPVEIEVETLEELSDALRAAPDWILLDNMSPEQLKSCVTLCAGRAQLEASGGITMATIEAVAESGVNAISLGCLTHSTPAADLSLEIK